MTLKENVLELLSKNKKIRTADVVAEFGVSRQFASHVLKGLVEERKIVKIGVTRSAFYVSPEHPANLGGTLKKRFKNSNLKEHEVLGGIEKQLPFLSKLNENIRSIFAYGFSEMLNNAIEHSRSGFIEVEVKKEEDNLIFQINDFGIGVFNSIMKKNRLQSELEAIQDLLKGKTTTAPKAHSGEGIFFTSKIGDVFILESFSHRLRVDNIINDTFIEEAKPAKRGTKVTFLINISSKKHLNDVFKKYQSGAKNLDFNKTEIKVKLYTLGTIYVSRSQARRLLSGLEKFKLIILDFEKVLTIGQAFADEIFRVFAKKHPDIKIQPINMNEAAKFMVKRVSN